MRISASRTYALGGRDIVAEGACQVTDSRLLVIAFSLGSKVQWEFTPDEFIGGLAKHKYNHRVT